MSHWHQDLLCTAFAGPRAIATGRLVDVVRVAKSVVDRNDPVPVLVFDDVTSEVVEVDFRGGLEQVIARIPPAPTASDPAREDAPRGRGRPRLGVKAREVTLLPAHWDYLNAQPGGASVALRKLVDRARRDNSEKDRIRVAQETAYRFMSAMGGNEAGFEEATRALFGRDRARFEEHTAGWHSDVRAHALKISAAVFC